MKAIPFYFNDSSSRFSKYYIDYYMKLIKRSHVLTAEENNLIFKAYIKYYSLNILGVIGFMIVLRRFYKASLYIDFSQVNYSFYDTLKYCSTALSILLLSFFSSERIYCSDLKYIVIKYSDLDKDKYIDSKLNKLILDSYYIDKS